MPVIMTGRIVYEKILNKQMRIFDYVRFFHNEYLYHKKALHMRQGIFVSHLL